MTKENTYHISAELKEKLKTFDYKKANLTTANEVFDEKYGLPDSPSRIEFDEKAKAWYYGEILRQRRKDLGMTQKELAKRIGRERTYINRIEQGETDMQLSSFLRIASALGISLQLTVNF